MDKARIWLRLLFLLFAILRFASAQAPAVPAPAPIERRVPMPLPDAPVPAPTQAEVHADKQWDRLVRGTRYLRPEVRIQAVGDSIRCDVDKVTSDEIFCTQHRADNGPFASMFRPKEMYHVPRREIRDIRVGGRELSTVLGAGIGIGIGVGVGVGSGNADTRADGAQAILALLFGGVGALIGHALPLSGHPVYQAP